MVDLYSNQVKPSKGQDTLAIVTTRGFADVVEKLLQNGEDVDIRSWLGGKNSVLYNAIEGFKNHNSRDLNEGVPQAYLNTIQILIQYGANIFEINDNG